MVGTILPNAASVAATSRYAAADAALRERVGLTIAEVRRVVVGGEVRWYRNDSVFAVVNASGRILWFETRADGHVYSARW